MIMGTLFKHSIPLDNFIGFVADGAANIMGQHNYCMASRLQVALPGITIFKCVCHSIYLCESEAAKTLPRRCEDLRRDIYSYFSHSAKRKHEFKEFQVFCEVKPYKLLHACRTRWLSLHQVVSRIIEQWRPLTLYFTSRVIEDGLVSVQHIVDRLRDPAVLCYFTFLD